MDCDSCAQTKCERCGAAAAMFNAFWEMWLCFKCVDEMNISYSKAEKR